VKQDEWAEYGTPLLAEELLGRSAGSRSMRWREFVLQLRRDLVFDIGVYNGDDTAYYLFKGYHVLAIEADPSLMAGLQARFAAELARGQLQILNIALARTRGSVPFWICEGYSLWNSLDREHASRMGRTARAVNVECWPLRDLLAYYGVPHYLKLSLHGAEYFCLADLTPEALPTYISLELPRDLGQSDELFSRLLDLGYDSSKIIDQTTQRQFVVRPKTVSERLRGVIKRHPRLQYACEKTMGVARSVLRPVGERQRSGEPSAAQEGWIFPEGSSGPFGEETDGAWRTTADAYADWKVFLNDGRRSHNLSVWHDLHAMRTNPTASTHESRESIQG
jgi:FkbM family methyltransferase